MTVTVKLLSYSAMLDKILNLLQNKTFLWDINILRDLRSKTADRGICDLAFYLDIFATNIVQMTVNFCLYVVTCEQLYGSRVP